jgi:hypothetical protein
VQALTGDRDAARAYNAWVRGGGFTVAVWVDPGTDLWMRGVRTATVSKIGTKWVHIFHAASGKTFRIAPSLISRDN